MVKIPLKGEVVGRALNSHGNYIVDHGKSWKNHGIVFLNFYGNPVIALITKLEVLALTGMPLDNETVTNVMLILDGVVGGGSPGLTQNII